MQVFESDLRGKTVMTAEGSFLGVLRNVSADLRSGDLTGLHIELAPEIDRGLFTLDDKGRAKIPFHSIKAVRDVVVVAV